MKHIQDTIAAIATPMGAGAIGIIRLSGPESLSLAYKLFYPKEKKIKPYQLTHGWITGSQGRILDEVLVSSMPGPHSYTGEDTVEINCHGNPAILEAVLEAVLSLGARPAEPGEFTKRAFLNGKMDLTQAEAVLEMINAPTETGIGLARNKLQGHLAGKIKSLRRKLEELKQQLCVAVDFPEEEIECLPGNELARRADSCVSEIAAITAGYDQSRIWTDGVLTVLTGRVNTGKSSIMNAVLGRERAIVTEIPGTTRDYLEEAVNLGGLPVRLVDTAGLRQARDQVEIEGMQRGKELIDCADILILVLDSTREPSSRELEILNTAIPEKIIIALNKWDLVSVVPDWTLKLERDWARTFRVSAKNGTGLKELLTGVREMALSGRVANPEGALVPNLRQKTCLEQAAEELSQLAREAVLHIPYDLLAARLDYACSHLDQVTGRITSDEILNSIFDNFCIGK
ncbi:MAG: tRNA uridine-5-carboxymethylaminomethyl(34) synthesis GTPase MnmE [Desulfonatronovibrio sp.]